MSKFKRVPSISANPELKKIERFIDNLSNFKCSDTINNIYHPNSSNSQLLRDNLKLYFLQILASSPECLLVGEAPGYKGCRLTGIPFSSERVLNDHPFFKDQNYSLNSPDSILESEISATILWEGLANHSSDSMPLLWNIFPFHPHKPGNIRSNRTPNAEELKAGKGFLDELLRIFSIQRVAAIGRSAESMLDKHPLFRGYIRHPAYGGKSQFISGLKRIL